MDISFQKRGPVSLAASPAAEYGGREPAAGARGSEPRPVGGPAARPAPEEAPPSGSAESLRFSIDESRGTVVVEVVDEATGEVIRTIPSEEVRSAMEALRAQGRSAIDRVA